MLFILLSLRGSLDVSIPDDIDDSTHTAALYLLLSKENTSFEIVKPWYDRPYTVSN